MPTNSASETRLRRDVQCPTRQMKSMNDRASLTNLMNPCESEEHVAVVGRRRKIEAESPARQPRQREAEREHSCGEARLPGYPKPPSFETVCASRLWSVAVGQDHYPQRVIVATDDTAEDKIDDPTFSAAHQNGPTRLQIDTLHSGMPPKGGEGLEEIPVWPPSHRSGNRGFRVGRYSSLGRTQWARSSEVIPRTTDSGDWKVFPTRQSAKKVWSATRPQQLTTITAPASEAVHNGVSTSKVDGS
ncbi:hypothetical protein EXIGLDRAFT_333079 [Exidia glandulosa HHB12029]|uniref:Uncharacterized protein n=1 Tax=Exidia glandulosa HHB12029 TaxID=1314781 RepID=A0A165LM59_EXIGL|nr:hypothetical protein EXIGLDRAFT_333079 [Exidia glandulosa HHB12029]